MITIISSPNHVDISHPLLDCVCNCNCNLFAVYNSKLGYSPVDIDFVTYMPSNIIYT